MRRSQGHLGLSRVLLLLVVARLAFCAYAVVEVKDEKRGICICIGRDCDSDSDCIVVLVTSLLLLLPFPLLLHHLSPLLPPPTASPPGRCDHRQ